MGTANAGPSASVNDLAAANGLTVGMAGGYSGDPNDRDLIWDREEQTPFGRAETGQASGGWRGRPGGLQPVIFKESHAQKHLYNRPDSKEVQELQNRLWAGGFYPPGAKRENLTPGLPDPYTEKAWENLIDRAAKYKAAGKDMTIWEVLEEGEGIMGPGGADRAGADGRQPHVTELTNPEDLKYYAQKVAVSTLGRALKPDEVSRFVSSFQGAQATAQTQAYNLAGASGGTVVSPASPAAAAEAFARQAAPVEASAHDQVKVFDVVSKMLGGKRGRG